ncbi:MAG: hypothetical protein MRY64_09795 [Hyphomonadaceae bacterium]|nr:hypothetical protein [Hyphomonadaceae bacterium]
MFDRNDLRAAVEAGVLSESAARDLERFLTRRSGADASGDPESLRFLANLNDIFLSIGILLLLAGTVAFSANLILPEEPTPLRAALALVPAMALSWGLAEYFCLRRRLLLPSIVLCAAFCLLTGLAASLIVGNAAAEDIRNSSDIFYAAGNLGMLGGLTTGAGALAFFLRFRLPFGLFVLALALAVTAYSGVAFFGNTGLVIGGTLSLIIGLITLTVAVFLDAGDPQRLTRRSDHAFWLHLAAAPQIILGLRGMTLGFFGGSAQTMPASLLLVSLLGFALLSLALNRRALIVSSLLTYAIALTALIGNMGLGVVNTTIFTLLVLGSAVVLIGGGWSTARRMVLTILPRGGIFSRIFPDELASPGLARA